MIRSRRLAFAAAAVVAGLAVASCGDPAQTTSSDASTSATPPVIKLGTGSGSTNSGAAPAAESDRMMMPYAIFHYVYEGDLPALDGSAPAYQFPAGAQVDPPRIAAIAAVLGVEGEVREAPADMGSRWMVGPEDYSGATLSVGSDGMVSWWFSPAPMATPGVECVDAVMVDPAVGEGARLSGAATPPDTGTGGGEVPTRTAFQWFAARSLSRRRACPMLRRPSRRPRTSSPRWASAPRPTSTRPTPMSGVPTSPHGSCSTGRRPRSRSLSASAPRAPSPGPVVCWPSRSRSATIRSSVLQAGLERLNDESGMWTWYGGGGAVIAA